jgi:hypothetical protein
MRNIPSAGRDAVTGATALGRGIIEEASEIAVDCARPHVAPRKSSLTRRTGAVRPYRRAFNATHYSTQPSTVKARAGLLLPALTNKHDWNKLYG